MHTVELLEQAIRLAEEAGYIVRQDHFAPASSGVCELRGRRWLFVELSMEPAERLEFLLDVLSGALDEERLTDYPDLSRQIRARRAA